MPNLFTRERLELEDGDYLDLDWINNQSKRLVLLSHGIEGNSQSYYVTRAAKFFSQQNWDVLAWNFRSCSKPLNTSPKLYHIGDTEDLSEVVTHALSSGQYETIVLVGYSMGGSMILKYLGEQTRSELIKGAITYSVPCDFEDSLRQSEKLMNRLYVRKILKKLKRKLYLKQVNTAVELTVKEIESINSIREFNEKIILPLYGFNNLATYNEFASCNRYLSSIKVPTFIGNAKNDPMLGRESYPIALAKGHQYVHLEEPLFGGHLGFTPTGHGPNWMEFRAASFLDNYVFI